MYNKNSQSKKNDNHKSNKSSTWERVIYILLSIVLFLYGTFGILIGKIYFPLRKGGVYLHGIPAYLLYAAMLCTVANMMSIVIRHYDQKGNEGSYQLFARISQIASWILFLSAILMNTFVYQ